MLLIHFLLPFFLFFLFFLSSLLFFLKKWLPLRDQEVKAAHHGDPG